MNAKKVLLSVVAIALILSVVSMIGFAAEANPYDVNGDGKVSVVDAKWVLQAVAGLRDLTPTDATEATADATESTATEATESTATEATEATATDVYGDVNGDGKVSVLDAKLILVSLVADATESTATNA